MIRFTASPAQFRGSKKPVSLFDLPPCPAGLVLTEADKLRPTGIGDGFGQVLVFEHPVDVQVLKGDIAVPLYQIVAELVVKILALVGDPFMLNGYLNPGLAPVERAFLLAAQPALADLQPSLRFTQVLGGLDFLPGGQGDKIFESQVNPYPPFPWFQVSYLHLTLNRDEILPAFGFRDGAIFHLAFQGAMKDGLDPTDLGQVDSLVINLEALRVADGLAVFFAFEPGVFSPTGEEVLIGPVQVLALLLKDLAIGLLQPFSARQVFKLFDLVIDIIARQPLAGCLVVFFAPVKRPVIDEAGMAELDGQISLLCFGRVDPVLVGFAYQHVATSQVQL